MSSYLSNHNDNHHNNQENHMNFDLVEKIWQLLTDVMASDIYLLTRFYGIAAMCVSILCAIGYIVASIITHTEKVI